MAAAVLSGGSRRVVEGSAYRQVAPVTRGREEHIRGLAIAVASGEQLGELAAGWRQVRGRVCGGLRLRRGLCRRADSLMCAGLTVWPATAGLAGAFSGDLRACERPTLPRLLPPRSAHLGQGPAGACEAA